MPEPAHLRSFKGCRILVVEDEYIMAADLKDELTDLGAEVLGPVPSLERAFELLDAHAAQEAEPHAAILDVNLGGEMSFPLADALRERGVPFLFATGYDNPSIPENYCGVPRCKKPFATKDCLQKLLEHVLSGDNNPSEQL